MITSVAKRFDTRERDELSAELCRRLIQFKARRILKIRNREAYMAKLLLNKASNLVRDWRKRIACTDTFDETIHDAASFSGIQGSQLRSDGTLDQLAMAEVWKDLPLRLRRFWIVLLEENGNQARSAKRLGKHRNTARSWVTEIKNILKRHGF